MDFFLTVKLCCLLLMRVVLVNISVGIDNELCHYQMYGYGVLLLCLTMPGSVCRLQPNCLPTSLICIYGEYCVDKTACYCCCDHLLRAISHTKSEGGYIFSSTCQVRL